MVAIWKKKIHFVKLMLNTAWSTHWLQTDAGDGEVEEHKGKTTDR